MCEGNILQGVSGQVLSVTSTPSLVLCLSASPADFWRGRGGDPTGGVAMFTSLMECFFLKKQKRATRQRKIKTAPPTTPARTAIKMLFFELFDDESMGPA